MRNLQTEKGKPIARWGRKVMDLLINQSERQTAGEEKCFSIITKPEKINELLLVQSILYLSAQETIFLCAYFF